MTTQDAIDHFGSIRKLADVLGIEHVQSIYQWKGVVPQARQYQLQIITKGKLKAEKKSAA